jgi:protein-S-isoprenylcysteine O-methyltransferase Ste14
MRRYWFPKPYADTVARLRVPSGFLLVVLFAWLAQPTIESLTIGIPISVLGLVLRAWAAGHLAKNRELATSGPYAFMRNPLYVGTLLVAAGVVISANRGSLAAVFAAVFALVYLPVIELEEQHLRKLFPSYEEYAQRVPLLLPWGRWQHGKERFRMALYLKNQEFQALLGYLVGLLYLLWKAGVFTSAAVV